MPDFSARLRKQLDDQWSNILIRRKSAEAILALVEAEMICHGLRGGDDLEAEAKALEALRALNEE